MTKQEKIIVSAYTGVLMCDFDDVHEYIQKKLGRPVYTHELADKGIKKEVKEKSHEDFLEICNREESEPKWIPCSERMPEEGQKCLVYDKAIGFRVDTYIGHGNPFNWELFVRDYEAWMPIPKLTGR